MQSIPKNNQKNIDIDGMLINKGDISLIQPLYMKALKTIKQALSNFDNQFPSNEILSFYVRGSVSAGEAVPPISDIDIVIVLDSIPDKKIISFFSKISEKAAKLFAPQITEVDITVTTLPALIYDKKIKNLKIYMKYKSTLIKGKNILDKLPSVYPGPSLAIYMYDEIDSEILSLRDQFNNTGEIKTYQNKTRDTRFWCVWLMRTILRSSMALCMFDGVYFTQNLRECAELAKSIYPELSEMLDKALILAVNPTDNNAELVDFIDRYTVRYLKLWNDRRNLYEKSY